MLLLRFAWTESGVAASTFTWSDAATGSLVFSASGASAFGFSSSAAGTIQPPAYSQAGGGRVVSLRELQEMFAREGGALESTFDFSCSAVGDVLAPSELEAQIAEEDWLLGIISDEEALVGIEL